MSNRSWWRVAAFVLLCSCAVRSQEVTGSITGEITDPAGAAVSGAQVQLTNTGTGTVQSITADQSGSFRFVLLPPGAYSLQVTAAGFKTFRRDGLIVEVERSLAVPVIMQLGQVSETVEVSAASPLLDPNTSSLGTVMNTQKIQDLPLNGRNPMGLANLIPTVRGIGYFGGQVLSSWRLAAVSIGGGQPLSNGFMVDGIASDKMVDSGPMTFLTVDSTEEFKVQTNTLPAEFGRTSGGVITMISRSGTNDYHGGLFEFLRNDKLNANDFFANRAGRPIAPDKVNQFGGLLGGRVIKNKLFFFVNYEGYRERSFGIETITSPNDAQRSGDFSGLTTAAGAPITIYDPATTRPDPAHPGSYLRDPFPGNIIPSNRINPVAAAILKYYPEPNLKGLYSNTFLQSPTPINKDYGSGRLDYVLSPAQRISRRYTADDLRWQFANYFNNIADVDGRLILVPRKNAYVGYTNTISPTLLFDGRIGFNHQVEAYTIPGQGFDITQLGMPASLLSQGQPAPGAGKPGVFPRLSISDLTTFGSTSAAANHTNTGSAAGTLTKIHGGHAWKFGYEYRLYQRNEFTLNFPDGTYSFNRGFTQGPNPDQGSSTSGYSVASFLLGDPAGGSAGINAASAITVKYNALFAQDDWKVNRRLTLNLGLRWEKEGGATERHNIYADFDPNIASPLQVPGLNLKGGLVYPGVNGHPRAFFASSDTNFQPRVGMAYQLADRTVLRGGYGISFVPTTQGTYTSSQTGFSSTTLMVTSNDGGRTPAATLSNPFPNGLVAPTGSSLGALTGVGGTVFGSLYDLHRGYAQEWNFTLQHQPWQNWLFEVAYVGNRGIHLFMYNQNLNQVPNNDLALGTQLGQLVSNPFYGIIHSGPLAAAQVPLEQTLLPYPQFTALPGSTQGGVISPFSYMGNSWYHALTVKVEKRFSRGVSLLASYAKSKLEDEGDNLSQVRPGGVTGSLVQNWNNLSAEKSKSLYDVPQRLVVTGIWDIPLGRGGYAFYRAIAGGWQLNSIMTIESGRPIPLGAVVQGGGNR